MRSRYNDLLSLRYSILFSIFSEKLLELVPPGQRPLKRFPFFKVYRKAYLFDMKIEEWMLGTLVNGWPIAQNETKNRGNLYL